MADPVWLYGKAKGEINLSSKQVGLAKRNPTKIPLFALFDFNMVNNLGHPIY